MRKFRFLDLLNPSAFFLMFILFYFILIILLNYITSVNLIKFNIRQETYYVLYLFFVVFIVSAYIITPSILGYKPKRASFIIFDLSIKKINVVVFFLVLFGWGIHLFYFFKIGFIPSFHANVSLVRISAKAGFGGGLLLANGALYAAIILLSYKYYLANYTNKISTLLVLIMSTLIISGVGFRGPAAYLVLIFSLSTFFLSISYIKSKKIPKKLIVFCLFFILFLSVIDYLRYGNEFSLSSFLQLFWTMTVNLYNLNNIVDGILTDKLTYLWGESFLTDIAVAIPGMDSQFLGVTLVSQLGLSFEGEGMTVTAPGEAFINFGYLGVVIYAFLLGFVCEVLFQMLTTKNKASSILILSFFSLSFAKVVIAGLTPTLVFTLVPVLLFLIPSIIWCKK